MIVLMKAFKQNRLYSQFIKNKEIYRGKVFEPRGVRFTQPEFLR